LIIPHVRQKRSPMPIPDYQTLMLPLLKVAGDGREHRTSDVANRLARDFKLTEDERQQLLPSGKQATFTNRVAWAKTYLVQAGLLAATKRAHFTITDRGRKVLAETPASIDNEYLCQFPEFILFPNAATCPQNLYLQMHQQSPPHRRRRKLQMSFFVARSKRSKQCSRKSF
jgi:restriction system protein